MDDSLWLHGADEILHPSFLAQATDVKPGFGYHSLPKPLGQIVDDVHFMPGLNQFFHADRANVARSPCD